MKVGFDVTWMDRNNTSGGVYQYALGTYYCTYKIVEFTYRCYYRTIRNKHF